MEMMFELKDEFERVSLSRMGKYRRGGWKLLDGE